MSKKLIIADKKENERKRSGLRFPAFWFTCLVVWIFIIKQIMHFSVIITILFTSGSYITIQTQGSPVPPLLFPSPTSTPAVVAPQFLSVHQLVEVSVGSTALLNCRLTKLEPQHTVSWMRSSDMSVLTVGGLVFSSDSRIHVKAPDTREQMFGSWGLLIEDTTTRDSGDYQCQVNTEPKESLDVTLIVTDKNSESLEIRDEKKLYSVFQNIKLPKTLNTYTENHPFPTNHSSIVDISNEGNISNVESHTDNQESEISLYKKPYHETLYVPGNQTSSQLTELPEGHVEISLAQIPPVHESETKKNVFELSKRGNSEVVTSTAIPLLPDKSSGYKKALLVTPAESITRLVETQKKKGVSTMPKVDKELPELPIGSAFVYQKFEDISSNQSSQAHEDHDIASNMKADDDRLFKKAEERAEPTNKGLFPEEIYSNQETSVSTPSEASLKEEDLTQFDSLVIPLISLSFVLLLVISLASIRGFYSRYMKNKPQHCRSRSSLRTESSRRSSTSRSSSDSLQSSKKFRRKARELELERERMIICDEKRHFQRLPPLVEVVEPTPPLYRRSPLFMMTSTDMLGISDESEYEADMSDVTAYTRASGEDFDALSKNDIANTYATDEAPVPITTKYEKLRTKIRNYLDEHSLVQRNEKEVDNERKPKSNLIDNINTFL